MTDDSIVQMTEREQVLEILETYQVATFGDEYIVEILVHMKKSIAGR